MKMTSLLIACGLALAPAACKKDKKDGVPSPKSVESAEKEAMEAKADLADEREDIAEAKEEVAEQADDVVRAGGDFAKQRDEFVVKAKARMATIEARLSAIRDDLAASAKNLKGEARADVDKLMLEIEAERAKAKTAFDAAASGAKDKWNDLEKNTGEALQDLSDKTDTLAEKLKSAGVKLRAKAEAADQ
jgi:hypothetical protein